MERIKIKYNGVYRGTNPATGLTFEPGEVKEVDLEDAEILVESGQFTVLEESDITVQEVSE